MKLILAASAIALTQAAFETTGGANARWKLAGGNCMEMQDKGNTFARMYVKECETGTEANKIQNFRLNGGLIESNDGKRCLYLNPNTKLYTMALKDKSDRFCTTADNNANRFTRRGDGRITLVGNTSNCVRPQVIINKKFNKVVNGPGCTNDTDLKDFENKGVNNTAQTRTYSNEIYNAIHHLRTNNSSLGPFKSQVYNRVESQMGGDFRADKFEEQWKKNLSANTIFSNKCSTGNSQDCFRNTKDMRGQDGDKKANNLRKRVFKAMKTGNAGWLTVDQIVATMKSQDNTMPADKDKVLGLIKRAADNTPSALEKSGNSYRLKDQDCDRGLTGVCNNKNTDAKKANSWNKMIAAYFNAIDKSNDRNYKTVAAIVSWINSTYPKDAVIHSGELSKADRVKNILTQVAGNTDSNVETSSGNFRLKDPKCKKGLTGVCDKSDVHSKKTDNLNKIVTATIRALSNSATRAEIIAKAKSSYPSSVAAINKRGDFDKKITDFINNNLAKTNSNVQENSSTKKISLKDLKCNKGIKGICDNKKSV